VRVGVLGPLQVRAPDGRLVKLGGQRLRALLILLALDAGRVVPASSLIGRLWPDERPADAPNALQSLVSRLRATLRQASLGEDLIESSPAGYRLAVPPEAVDAMTFEAGARAGGRALADGDPRTAAHLLREALSAWRGPALADVANEEFAAAPAARLEELRSTAALDRIEADLALGEASGSIGELRALTTADPLAERPRALLMRALAAAGRQADALAAYAQARDLLADQLGVDPSAQLEQTYLAILRQEVPLQPAVPCPPPAAPIAPFSDPERTVPPPDGKPARLSGVQRPPTSFIGRDDDVSGVLKKLAGERLVTLTGPGGVGKTRLAAEAAARLAAPAWFAELAPVSEPSEVPFAVLDALGLPERVIGRQVAGPGGPVGRICDALANREAVLILDNCEQVVDAAASLAEQVLAGSPRVRILATSREPLRISGETLWPVTPLQVPPLAPDQPAIPLQVPPLAPDQPAITSPAAPVPAAPASRATPSDIPDISAFPSVRLFRDRASAVLPSFALDDGNAAAVTRICRTLDGLPLAIELAAVWLRTLTPAQLAERLDDRFALLTGGSRTALPRHQTLRAVVDWSWDLLSERERVLARRLALFPGGATLIAAEQVCQDSLLPRAAVLPALSGLVGKSILTVAQPAADSGPRYRMLETVRAYALERLAEAGEEARVRDAFTAHYLNLAETGDPLLRTAAQLHWFRELTAEQDNAHAALRWAIARGDADTALRLVRSLSYYWVQRGHGEGDSLARDVLGLPVPPLTRRIAEARVICALLAAGWTWDIESVRGPLTDSIAALSRWAQADDYATMHPIALLAEPMLTLYDGESERALAKFERFTTAPDPWVRAWGLLYRASNRGSLGHMDGTEADCLAALREFRSLGESWGTAITLAQLAEFAELRADHAASIAALDQAAELGRELGTWGDMSYIEGKLAIIRARAGDLGRARADLDQAERSAVARGTNTDTDRWLCFMRAELEWRAGDYPAAARACELVLAAIADAQALWWQSLRAHVKARLAMVALAEDDLARCHELLVQALHAAGDWVEHPPLAGVLDALAAYALRRGQVGDAELAATLLGGAHAVRGAFDESSLDAPAARAAARAALGEPAFDAAYQRGRELSRVGALAYAGDVLSVD
jgi:predicted ATPase/DNA-binding SARP family transcriptional activator